MNQAPRTQLQFWMFVPLSLFATVIAAIVYGRGPFFLGLAFTVLIGVIAFFWSSLLSLTGDAPLTLNEALGLAAPSAEEERKVAVLRALKDLEYERSVGKITDQDYRELSEKYRSEAKRLLQILDEQMTAGRLRAEQLLNQRLEELNEPAIPKPQESAAPATTDSQEQSTP